MMSRFRMSLLLCGLFALALVACSPEQSPVEPTSGPDFFSLKADPTPKDEEFLSHLKAGTFTICKVVVDGEGGEKFDFEIEAVGPGVATAPIYLTNVTLGNDECADVYQAPDGSGIGPDTVTMSELVPDGWQIDRVAIWSLDELPEGGFETTFHELGPGTATIQGSIDAGKSGCVAIFYNSPDEKKKGECTRTPGYWKTHPEAWPVEEITIGGTTYSKDDAIALLWLPEAGDKTKTVFRALVAAVLNVESGSSTDCIGSWIDDAQAWMAAHPVCSGVPGRSQAWHDIEPVATGLDDYNNGYLDCADHCGDEGEEEDGGGQDDVRGVDFD